MRLVWAAAALRDLAAARAYIAHDNPPAADNQIGRILVSVTRLLRFPEIGRPGRRGGTRELVVAKLPYIIAYRLVRSEAVQVLRIWHGAQDRH